MLLKTGIIHYRSQQKGNLLRSHHLSPEAGVTLFLLISGKQENIVSVVEDHFLETLSGIEWNKETLHSDFSFVSENYNHFTQNIPHEENDGIDIIFAVLIGNSLIFSHTGNGEIFLFEQGKGVSMLSEQHESQGRFQAFSSGEISTNTDVYFSNERIEARIGEDLLEECQSIDDISWEKNIKNLIEKEIGKSVDVGYIRACASKEEGDAREFSRKKKQSDILRNSVTHVRRLWGIHGGNVVKNINTTITSKYAKETQYAFLIGGIILLFFLIYSVLGGIFSVINSPATDSKNQLLKARELIEQSQKLTTNPTSFNQNIKEAETILFALRAQKAHMADTQELLGRIEAMKKEVNDVQTVDMRKLTPLAKIDDGRIAFIGGVEINKKMQLLGEKNAILDHVRDAVLPKSIAYPPGEEARDFTTTEDGNFFILTQNDRVLSRRGNEITYVTVTGQDGWEKANLVKSFNGNLYLANTESGVIYRHKPGINGFSAKVPIIEGKTQSKIVNIGIDGGIYMLMEDGKISRYISGKGEKNITINKVPGEYTLGKNPNTELIVGQNLSYIYVQSGNNIWIFSPDAKRFQDITAWNYVAQLELSYDEDIRSISVPRDGSIYVTTATNIFEIVFEIADGKIILK